MVRENPTKPAAPELPKYLREPLEKQTAGHEEVASYAADLAGWKRQQRQENLEHRRAEEEIDEEELEDLNEREISTDPEDYEDVPLAAHTLR